MKNNQVVLHSEGYYQIVDNKSCILTRRQSNTLLNIYHHAYCSRMYSWRL